MPRGSKALRFGLALAAAAVLPCATHAWGGPTAGSRSPRSSTWTASGRPAPRSPNAT